MEKVELWNVPRNTRINVEHLDLVRTDDNEPVKELLFKHIDGMYSLCLMDDGGIVHLKAWTPVVIIEDEE